VGPGGFFHALIVRSQADFMPWPMGSAYRVGFSLFGCSGEDLECL